MLGNDLHTTRRNVGDGTVTRQTARSKLDFGETPAYAPFACASIYKHSIFTPPGLLTTGTPPVLLKKYWNSPSSSGCN